MRREETCIEVGWMDDVRRCTLEHRIMMSNGYPCLTISSTIFAFHVFLDPDSAIALA